MSLYKIIATFSWLLFTLGLLRRKNKNIHIPLMLSAITLDVVVVVILEVTRNAVKTASEFKLSALAQTHIFVSSIAMLHYPVLIFLGVQLYRGKYGKKGLHRRLGVSCYAFRTLGFGFMFFV